MKDTDFDMRVIERLKFSCVRECAVYFRCSPAKIHSIAKRYNMELPESRLKNHTGENTMHVFTHNRQADTFILNAF